MPDPTDDLVVDQRIRIPAADLSERFTTSGGPGGQHANRSSTKVELSVDLTSCGGLSAAERQRLISRLGPRIVVHAAEERSQTRNRSLARRRLAAVLRNALVVRRNRRPTTPTAASVDRRISAKRRRSAVKDGRRRPAPDD
ncbi:MAG: alternative ribosome rescue aminoacyl-tRNA hydrolase ArfB [Actinomycetota bacterium]